MAKQIYVLSSDYKARREECSFPYARKEAALHCAVGGHDAVQFVIRSQESVACLDASVSAFQDEDGQTLKENVEVFLEHYAEVDTPTRNNRYVHPIGYYPDALIPMETAKKYGENCIKANENSAIYLSFFARDCKSGAYRAEITLYMDEERYVFPIKLVVYDVDVRGRDTMQTMFLMRENFIKAGEGEKSKALLYAYYDFFLSYRIMPYTFPVATLDVKEFADAVEKYYDREHFTGYGFPSQLGGGAGVFDFSLLREQIRELARRSCKTKNLLDKAFIKNGDEPEDNGTIESLTAYEKETTAFLRSVAVEIAADESDEFARFKKNPTWRESIEDMQIVVPFSQTWTTLDPIKYPSGIKSALLESINAWCPKPVAFDLPYVSVTEQLHKKYQPKGKLWWYLCNDPVWPYPSYHIDDVLIGARLLSYMQYRHDVTGNLYWSPVCFKDSCRPHGVTKYDRPYRAGGIGVPSGEGYLVYPGSPYGHFGPLPSLRLEAIRGGMEDYEVLKIYDEKIRAFCDSVGFNDADPKSVIDTYLDGVVCGTQFYEDYEALTECRTRILRDVSFYEKEDYRVVRVVQFGDRGEVSVFTRNGVRPRGAYVEQGRVGEWTQWFGTEKYERTKNYLTFDGSEKRFYLSTKREALGVFETLPTRELIDASDGATCRLQNGKLRISCPFKQPERDDTFIPGIIFSASYFGKDTLDLTGSRYFTIKIKSDDEESVNLQLVFYAKGGYLQVLDTYLVPHKEETLSVRTDRIEWSKLNAITAIGLQFGTSGVLDGETISVEPQEISVVY